MCGRRDPLLVPRLIGDPIFSQGTAPFALLMGGLALASPYLAFTQILLMAGKPGLYTLFTVLVVGVNFVSNALLIGPLGPVGAAASTSIAVVASALLTRRFARARIGVKI
jgi:O-antigen/teichoic acid export membrane protein